MMLDSVTGEVVEKALSHERKEEVRAFYAGLEGSVRVGIEASGQSQWFERMLAELGHEVWIGDAAKIRASCERKQKTDRRDAELLMRLLAEDRFPRIWVPTAAERDGRQLLLHRHKLVRMRTQMKNQLQAQALNQGVQQKRKLWSEVGRKQLESLPLLPWASRRRAELLQLLDQPDRGTTINDLLIARMKIAAYNLHVRLLSTEPWSLITLSLPGSKEPTSL
jgi:transposase